MKWDLFFSDLLARLLGIFGLFASGLWCIAVVQRASGTSPQDLPLLPSALALLCLAFTFIFLLPNTHDRIVRLTFPFFARLLFLPFALVGCVAVAFGLFGLSALLPVSQQFFSVLAPALVVGTGVLFGILVFPGGLAYREPRRAFREAMPIQAMPKAGRTDHAQTPPGTPVMPRKADVWDFLVGAPLGLALIASFYGFKISTVAQTASFDQLIDDNWLVGLAVTFGVLWVPVLASHFIRGEAYNPRAPRNKGLRKLLTLISIPPFVYISFAGVAYDGFPAVWNLVQDHEAGTVRYEIVNISSARRLSDCMTLQVIAQPDYQMFVCNMPATLGVGDQIDATGPLSAYGHTIEQINVVR